MVWEGIWILRYLNIEIFEYWDIGILRYLNIEIFEYLDIEILRYWDIDILGYWDTGILPVHHTPYTRAGQSNHPMPKLPAIGQVQWYWQYDRATCTQAHAQAHYSGPELELSIYIINPWFSYSKTFQFTLKSFIIQTCFAPHSQSEAMTWGVCGVGGLYTV